MAAEYVDIYTIELHLYASVYHVVSPTSGHQINHLSLNDPRTAAPNLSIASAILSAEAAANVVLKNICVGT